MVWYRFGMVWYGFGMVWYGIVAFYILKVSSEQLLIQVVGAQ